MKRTPGTIIPVPAAIFLAVMIFSNQASAQGGSPWSAKPKNLQVMPREWDGQRLAPVMKGFAIALGVRCEYCHVGEPGKPLNTFDFVSDANPNKDRAREMWRMIGDINGHLAKIEPSGAERVSVSCVTCHHGKPRPTTLLDDLRAAYAGKGADAAVATYASLKNRYYGRAAYDFGEGALNDLGYELMAKGDIAGAVKILRLNADEFPASANAWDSLGEVMMKSGDNVSAAKYYNKSLELDPRNRNAEEMLKKLKK
jgi:tetratricopeptide (TPR) repeat protein